MKIGLAQAWACCLYCLVSPEMSHSQSNSEIEIRMVSTWWFCLWRLVMILKEWNGTIYDLLLPIFAESREYEYFCFQKKVSFSMSHQSSMIILRNYLAIDQSIKCFSSWMNNCPYSVNDPEYRIVGQGQVHKVTFNCNNYNNSYFKMFSRWYLIVTIITILIVTTFTR